MDIFTTYFQNILQYHRQIIRQRYRYAYKEMHSSSQGGIFPIHHTKQAWLAPRHPSQAGKNIHPCYYFDAGNFLGPGQTISPWHAQQYLMLTWSDTDFPGHWNINLMCMNQCMMPFTALSIHKIAAVRLQEDSNLFQAFQTL